MKLMFFGLALLSASTFIPSATIAGIAGLTGFAALFAAACVAS